MVLPSDGVRGSDSREICYPEPALVNPSMCRSTSFLACTSVHLGLFLSVAPTFAGCGDSPEDDAGASQVSTSTPGGSSVGMSQPASSSGDPMGTTLDVTESNTTSDGGITSSGTSSEPPLLELCRMATSESECTGLDEACRWYPSYRVVDAAACVLEDPEYGCWATDSNGQAGCFDGPPAVCDEMNVRPLYREQDDRSYLILNTEGPCGFNPLAPPAEPVWIECPIDEFRPAPAVCYCVCGGPPNGTG